LHLYLAEDTQSIDMTKKLFISTIAATIAIDYLITS